MSYTKKEISDEVASRCTSILCYLMDYFYELDYYREFNSDTLDDICIRVHDYLRGYLHRRWDTAVGRDQEEDYEADCDFLSPEMAAETLKFAINCITPRRK